MSEMEKQMKEASSDLAEGGDFDIFDVGNYPEREQASAEQVRDVLMKRLAPHAEAHADLLAACKRADECMTNLMKAVPWGKTFDLDIAALNETLCMLPRAIKKAERTATEASS
jgi:hypothetical protein